MGFVRGFRNCALASVAALGIGYLTLFPASAQTAVHKPNSRYAIVVKDATFKIPEWKAVVDSLDERYGAEVFEYKENIEEVAPRLRDYKPTDMCLVGTPEDVGGPELPQGPGWNDIGEVMKAARKTVPVRFAAMANRLDDDPFRDARIGEVTGYTAADALRIATTHDFAINNALLKADEDKLIAFRNGVSYREDETNGAVSKTVKAGYNISETSLKAVGEDIFNTINTGNIQLVCTTGHGNYNQWKISYNEKRQDKWAYSQEGNIYLLDVETKEASGLISSTTPKVIIANGNCRMGGDPNKNAIFLAWMHSGGAVQCVGYQTDTWYGGAGWAINEHMFNNPGVSWSDAHKMTELGLGVRRERLLQARGGDSDLLPPTSDGDSHTLGHIYDSDNFTFYGDPGTRVTINFNPSWTPLYTKKETTITKGASEKYNFSLHINREGITKPIIFPVEKDLTASTLTTKPSDLFVKVIDDAVVIDPAWQTVAKEGGQLTIKNRVIKPGDDFSVELSVTK